MQDGEVLLLPMSGICKECGCDLSPDEIGLHRKLFDRNATEWMCIKCISEYLNVDKSVLLQKIDDFKAQGCTLFAR